MTSDLGPSRSRNIELLHNLCVFMQMDAAVLARGWGHTAAPSIGSFIMQLLKQSFIIINYYYYYHYYCYLENELGLVETMF